MSFSRVVNINSNSITIELGEGESRLITEVATKLVNVKTNEHFFFKSIKGDLGSVIDPKYKEMVKYHELYVDNNSNYHKVLSITPNQIEVDNGYGQSIKISCRGRDADATEIVNINTNHSFFFKSIKYDFETRINTEIYGMIELENLYVKVPPQPQVKPKSNIFNFFGGKKSRKQRYI